MRVRAFGVAVEVRVMGSNINHQPTRAQAGLSKGNEDSEEEAESQNRAAHDGGDYNKGRCVSIILKRAC